MWNDQNMSKIWNDDGSNHGEDLSVGNLTTLQNNSDKHTVNSMANNKGIFKGPATSDSPLTGPETEPGLLPGFPWSQPSMAMPTAPMASQPPSTPQTSSSPLIMPPSDPTNVTPTKDSDFHAMFSSLIPPSNNDGDGDGDGDDDDSTATTINNHGIMPPLQPRQSDSEMRSWGWSPEVSTSNSHLPPPSSRQQQQQEEEDQQQEEDTDVGTEDEDEDQTQ
eukprot:m.159223 g.159223  ORF g.159223 m.159223 type:complete len:220 (-) comp13366_c4_seq2:4032-4691(-)